MAIYEFDCESCGRHATAEELPRRGHVCFACHVKTVDLGFKYGKDNFHGPTIKERQNKILSDAKAAGINAVPSRDYGF
jgi:hypothetical protein